MVELLGKMLPQGLKEHRFMKYVRVGEPLKKETTDLEKFTSGEIYIGTFGRGIWKTEAYLGLGQNGSNNNPTMEAKLLTYPNPSNANTTLSFELNKGGAVDVAVYSITGRLVKQIKKSNMPSGENEVFIDAEDLPAGTYIIKLVSGKQNQSVKFMKL
ncbi:MAG: hypothetical protein RLZZ382_815 [Bacteroidota bacterium]